MCWRLEIIVEGVWPMMGSWFGECVYFPASIVCWWFCACGRQCASFHVCVCVTHFEAICKIYCSIVGVEPRVIVFCIIVQ